MLQIVKASENWADGRLKIHMTDSKYTSFTARQMDPKIKHHWFSKFGSEYLTFIVFFKAIFKLKLDVWWYDFAPGRRGGERRFLLSGAQSIDTTDITIQNSLTLPWNFPDFSLIKKKCADQINIAANWSWISFLIKEKKKTLARTLVFFSFDNGMR